MSSTSTISEQFLQWPNPPTIPCGKPTPEHKAAVLQITACCNRDFDAHLCGLQDKLKRLRFANLDISQLEYASSNWISWLDPFFAWTKDFCFQSGNCELQVDLEDISQDTTMIYFSLGNSIEDRTWYPFSRLGQPPLDYAKHVLCLCTVISIPEGTIDWVEEWVGDRVITDASTFDSAVYMLVDRCEETWCRYGFLTDGPRALFIKIQPCNEWDRSRVVFCQFIDCKEYSLAYCIAAVMHRHAFEFDTRRVFYSGALPENSDEIDPSIQTFANCRDFDIYTMERSAVVYQQFLELHEAANEAGLKTFPSIGSKLSFVDVNIVGRRLPALRANDRHTPLQPGDSKAIFDGIALRPRNKDVLRAIASHKTNLVFSVVEIKQAGDRKWSQVYVGQPYVGGTLLAGGVKLCVKLFDERFFRIPSLEDYYSRDNPSRILDVMIGDDMLVREESAYDRLKRYQGRILPNCYGFHEFSMPDGARVVGVLMECIEGQDFQVVSDANIKHWSVEEKTELLKRIRHITKALTHSGVNYHDWLLRQLLCRPKNPTKPDSFLRADDFDLILVDFACATQVWGCERGALLRTTPEIDEICNLLRPFAEPAAFREAGWGGPDECEVYIVPPWIDYD